MNGPYSGESIFFRNDVRALWYMSFTYDNEKPWIVLLPQNPVAKAPFKKEKVLQKKKDKFHGINLKKD